MCKKMFFKLIAIFIINSFLLLDIAWAGGSDIAKTSTLSPAIQINTRLLVENFQKICVLKDGKEIAATGVSAIKMKKPVEKPDKINRETVILNTLMVVGVIVVGAFACMFVKFLLAVMIPEGVVVLGFILTFFVMSMTVMLILLGLTHLWYSEIAKSVRDDMKNFIIRKISPIRWSLTQFYITNGKNKNLIKAVKILSEDGNAGFIELLLPGLGHKKTEVRRAARKLLAELGVSDNQLAVGYVEAFISRYSSTPEIKIEAAEALVELGDAGIDLLIAKIKNRSLNGVKRLSLMGVLKKMDVPLLKLLDLYSEILKEKELIFVNRAGRAWGQYPYECEETVERTKFLGEIIEFIRDNGYKAETEILLQKIKEIISLYATDPEFLSSKSSGMSKEEILYRKRDIKMQEEIFSLCVELSDKISSDLKTGKSPQQGQPVKIAAATPEKNIRSIKPRKKKKALIKIKTSGLTPLNLSPINAAELIGRAI